VARKFRDIVFKLIGVAVLLGSAFGAWLSMDYSSFVDGPLYFEDGAINYQVKAGDTLTSIASNMHERGIIQKPTYLIWLGRLKGTADTIKAGEYRFVDGVTPERMLQQMVTGEVVQYAITFVEGWTFRQMMDAVHSNEFLLHTLSDYSDEEIMQKIGHPGEHPEGRFLPDTYHFPRLTTDLALLQRAYNAMEAYLELKWPTRNMSIAVKTPYEALTLASIVEKETGLPSERKLIAGVFNRRLLKRMRLQTDPTVIYGLGLTFDGNIRRRDLHKDTPYNTYLHLGLPPTPIAMPGRAAILAVLDPEPGDDLYFVARGDGSHEFTSNLEDHNAAVQKYQLQGQ
jgi:UPF0755 protein